MLPEQAEELEAELDAAYDALEAQLRAMPCADSTPVRCLLWCRLFWHQSCHARVGMVMLSALPFLCTLHVRG